MVRSIQIDQEITEEEYRDVLNDIYGVVEICGMTYDSGRALQELDPVAFRCGKNDYTDSLDRKWECDECGTEYDDEEEANECCYVPVYRYTVDLDERGIFRAHVDDPDDVTVYEISNEDEDGNTGEIPEVTDGFMKHGRDLDGLKKHLQGMKIMPLIAELK